MDVTRLMDMPVELIEAWLPLIDLEIQESELSIKNLQSQIALRENEYKHASQAKSMARMVLMLKKSKPTE